MILLRSLAYYIFLFTSTVAYSLKIVFLSKFSDEKRLDIVANSWGSTNARMLAKLCSLNYRVEGLEILERSNCIIMCKHQSAWETIALRGLLPPNQSWVLKHELIKIPFFGSALRMSKPIAIDRSSGRQAVKQVIHQGVAALNEGRWVVIFPEGTRVAPGKKKKYGIGGALLAEKSGFPIIPIAHNAGIFWQRRGLKKYPGTIQVVIGNPIDTTGKKAKDIIKEVESWVESSVSRMPSSIQGPRSTLTR